MALTHAQQNVLDWMGGTMQPRSLRYIVLGAQSKNVPAHFSRFVCLYADRPRVRRFTVDLPESYSDLALPKRNELDKMLKRMQLPEVAEPHYAHYMRSAFPTLDAQSAKDLGVTQARNAGLPIGVFAMGITAIRQASRAILVVNALVSPTLFMEELRRAI